MLLKCCRIDAKVRRLGETNGFSGMSNSKGSPWGGVTCRTIRNGADILCGSSAMPAPAVDSSTLVQLAMSSWPAIPWRQIVQASKKRKLSANFTPRVNVGPANAVSFFIHQIIMSFGTRANPGKRSLIKAKELLNARESVGQSLRQSFVAAQENGG